MEPDKTPNTEAKTEAEAVAPASALQKTKQALKDKKKLALLTAALLLVVGIVLVTQLASSDTTNEEPAPDNEAGISSDEDLREALTELEDLQSGNEDGLSELESLSEE